MAINPWAPGEAWDAPRDNLAKPLGLIARGLRSTTRNLATTEGSILRLDGLALVAGRSYMIIANQLRFAVNSATTPILFTARIRWDDTGSAAGTSAAEIGRSQTSVVSGGGNDTASVIVAYVDPATSVTASFVLTGIAGNTAGGTPPTLLNDAPGPQLRVFDMGLSVADTGVLIG